LSIVQPQGMSKRTWSFPSRSSSWVTLPEDRMIGLNLAASQVLAVLVVMAVRIERPLYLDVALVYAILGFLGVLAVARSFFKKGAIR